MCNQFNVVYCRQPAKTCKPPLLYHEGLHDLWLNPADDGQLAVSDRRTSATWDFLLLGLASRRLDDAGRVPTVLMVSSSANMDVWRANPQGRICTEY